MVGITWLVCRETFATLISLLARLYFVFLIATDIGFLAWPCFLFASVSPRRQNWICIHSSVVSHCRLLSCYNDFRSLHCSQFLKRCSADGRGQFRYLMSRSICRWVLLNLCPRLKPFYLHRQTLPYSICWRKRCVCFQRVTPKCQFPPTQQLLIRLSLHSFIRFYLSHSVMLSRKRPEIP